MLTSKLSKFKTLVYAFGLLTGVLMIALPAQAAVYDWCAKKISNCKEPNAPGKYIINPAPTDSSGHAIDPTISGINYGCTSDHPNYLGCVTSANPPINVCCGPYTGGTKLEKCVALNGRCVEKTSSCKTDEEKKEADVSDCASGPDSLCCVPKAAAATAAKPPSEYKLANPLGTASIPVILGRIIKTFLGIVGAIALAVFVYGGVMWMTARGDAAQVKKGQDALKTAVIGLFIIMFANALAGSYVTFWTAKQGEIAAQEGRTTEAPTAAEGQYGATLDSQKAEAAKVEAGQAAASQSGAQQGVTTPPKPCNTPGLTPEEQVTCSSAGSSGWTGGWEDQSTYNTPAPNQGFGGQPTCSPPTLQPGHDGYQEQLEDYNKCLGNTSTIGFKTICNETVFDSGYGSFNKVSCKPIADCQSGNGNVLSKDCVGLAANWVGAWQTWFGSHCSNPFGNFGNNCGTGNVCCQLP